MKIFKAAVLAVVLIGGTLAPSRAETASADQAFNETVKSAVSQISMAREKFTAARTAIRVSDSRHGDKDEMRGLTIDVRVELGQAFLQVSSLGHGILENGPNVARYSLVPADGGSFKMDARKAALFLNAPVLVERRFCTVLDGCGYAEVSVDIKDILAKRLKTSVITCGALECGNEKAEFRIVALDDGSLQLRRVAEPIGEI